MTCTEESYKYNADIAVTLPIPHASQIAAVYHKQPAMCRNVGLAWKQENMQGVCTWEWEVSLLLISAN